MKSPMLYLERKQLVLVPQATRPWFAMNTLRSHRRPCTTLPELRIKENPSARLAVRPIEEGPAYVPEGVE